MTEEEKAIVMDKLNDYARQYAICKELDQCWELEALYHTEFMAVMELAAELGAVKFGAGKEILAEAVAKAKAEKEVSKDWLHH